MESKALSNHRKPDVPLRVTVSCEDKGNHVIVNVTDNGIGIPSEHQEKIFDPFQRWQCSACFGHSVSLLGS